MKKELPLTEIDQIANGENLLLLKALLPYLVPSDLRLPAMTIKVLELMNLANSQHFYYEEALHAMEHQNTDLPSMLSHISCFLPDSMENFVTQFAQITEIMQVLSDMPDTQNMNFEDIFSMMNGGNEHGESGMDERQTSAGDRPGEVETFDENDE